MASPTELYDHIMNLMHSVKDKLKQIGVDVIAIDTIMGARDFVPMNAGEAFGVLRLFPPSSEDLGPMDIPVFKELPLDLTVVAGTITKSFQNSMYHVNLKSKERNTPNMVLRSADLNHALLSKYNNKPVRFVVSLGGFSIEEVSMDVVKEKLKKRFDKPLTGLTTIPEKKLLRYREMCRDAPADCLKLNKKYGSKSSNLLFHKLHDRN